MSGGGALTLLGCTVVGKVHATLLSLVSDSIFWGVLTAGDTWTTALVSDRRQQGCVRFSFLPEGARTRARFECVEQALASPQPIFFAFRYGRPGYLKLLASTPDVVRKGADDGGEMGAFHFVLAPLREIDLRVRMQEYSAGGIGIRSHLPELTGQHKVKSPHLAAIVRTLANNIGSRGQKLQGIRPRSGMQRR